MCHCRLLVLVMESRVEMVRSWNFNWSSSRAKNWASAKLNCISSQLEKYSSALARVNSTAHKVQLIKNWSWKKVFYINFNVKIFYLQVKSFLGVFQMIWLWKFFKLKYLQYLKWDNHLCSSWFTEALTTDAGCLQFKTNSDYKIW